MSETSRSRVTITLGRTGQVVKRDGSTLDSSHSVAGSKRSVRERLGNNVDSSVEINNKRTRRDGGNAHDDTHLRKDDLRYKIMQKNLHKQSQNNNQNHIDLRNILSRPAQSSTNSITSRDKMPEPKDTRFRYLEPTNGRQLVSETRDGRHLLPMTRNSNPHIPEFRVDQSPDPRKQQILETREIARSILEDNDFRRRVPEPRVPNVVIDPYSPWTLERLRQRSPDESLATSRGPVAVAPKRDEMLQRKLVGRAYDDARTSGYVSKDALEISRPMSSSHLTKMAPPVGQMKTVAPVTAAPLPLTGGLTQKSPYMVDDQVTVDSFLRSLGLEKYAILFKAEEVDMYSLKRMAERDLKELGIPMGSDYVTKGRALGFVGGRFHFIFFNGDSLGGLTGLWSAIFETRAYLLLYFKKRSTRTSRGEADAQRAELYELNGKIGSIEEENRGEGELVEIKKAAKGPRKKILLSLQPRLKQAA
ncbi:hypothetical protein PHJA_001759500 [Phtheirospermum japonicum]|uniref:SAM domain-containing protein n=1 Tax=Phtheirospermum japonicum TaxID=374723 RepID=A0A830CIM9_9LAMI|nr:hypothetical protein PHJA_001759500 [Phtheirospermum japonicum]